MKFSSTTLRGPARLPGPPPTLPVRLALDLIRPPHGFCGLHGRTCPTTAEYERKPGFRRSVASHRTDASLQQPSELALPGAQQEHAPASDWEPLNGLTAVIAGAGPAGCTLAMHLAKAGWKVKVYERRPEPGPATSSRQRSWVLAMYPRGIRPVTAVAQVPLLRERAYKGLVVGLGKPGSKPIVLERTGVLMDRTLLATSLLDAARQQYGSRVEFSFGAPLQSVDFRRRVAAFRCSTTRSSSSSSSAAQADFERNVAQTSTSAAAVGAAPAAGVDDGSREPGLLEVPYNLLVGADGSNSTLRSLLAEAFPGQYDTTVLGYQDVAGSSSYKSVYGLPPVPEAEAWAPDSAVPASERLLGEFFCVLTGGDKGFISVCRDIDGTFCGYLAAKGQVFESLKTRQDYLDFLPVACPQLPAAWLPLLADKLLEAPVSSFPVMRSLTRFWAPGGVVLVGDAAHTVTPALGQGLNSALEDCELLAGELSSRSGGGGRGGGGGGGGGGAAMDADAIDAAVRRFSESRAPEVRALQELELLQSSSLTRLSSAPRALLPLLQLLARKWVIVQYSGLALLGTIAATAQAANRKKLKQQQQQEQPRGQQQQPQQQQQPLEGAGGHGSTDDTAGRPSVGSSLATDAVGSDRRGAAAETEAEAEATARADQLATQLDATYVRSPPMYELLRGHMPYGQMLVRVYGMAALGTGLTTALLYGLSMAAGGLAGRVLGG